MLDDNFLAYLGYCQIKSPTSYSYYDLPLYTYNEEKPAEGQYLNIVLPCPDTETAVSMGELLNTNLKRYPLKVGSFMTQLNPIVTCPFLYIISGQILILCPVYLYSKSFKKYQQNFTLFNNCKLSVEVHNELGYSVFGFDIYDFIKPYMLGDSCYDEMIYYSYNQLTESLTSESFSTLASSVLEKLIDN